MHNILYFYAIVGVYNVVPIAKLSSHVVTGVFLVPGAACILLGPGKYIQENGQSTRLYSWCGGRKLECVNNK